LRYVFVSDADNELEIVTEIDAEATGENELKEPSESGISSENREIPNDRDTLSNSFEFIQNISTEEQENVEFEVSNEQINEEPSNTTLEFDSQSEEPPNFLEIRAAFNVVDTKIGKLKDTVLEITNEMEALSKSIGKLVKVKSEEKEVKSHPTGIKLIRPDYYFGGNQRLHDFRRQMHSTKLDHWPYWVWNCNIQRANRCFWLGFG
jgi:hypothetical protein